MGAGPYPADRQCPEPDCPTILSRWNPGPECWRHSAAEPVSKREHRDDLVDLLQEVYP